MAVIIKGIDILELSAGTNSLQWAWQNGGPAGGEVLIFGENGQLTNGTVVVSGLEDNTSELEDNTSEVVNFYPTGMYAADNLSNYPGFTNAMHFDENSYLSRTFGSGDSTKWTFSFWFKKTRLAKDYWDWFFSNTTNAGLMLAYNGTNENYQVMAYDGDTDNSGYPASSSKMQLRDTKSWYHIIYTKNTTSGGRRWRMFVNGVEDINETAETSTVNNNFNTAIDHYIGSWYSGGSIYRKLNGYMANIQFIDGEALEPTDLGQYMVDSNGNTTSAWVPKLYDGDYGTNGFLLDFSSLELDSNGDIIQVNDTAPKTDGQSPNNWTAH
jgi:hypothetical protein